MAVGQPISAGELAIDGIYVSATYIVLPSSTGAAYVTRSGKLIRYIAPVASTTDNDLGVFTATSVVSGHRVVCSIGGVLVYASSNNLLHAVQEIGLTTNAAAIGDNVNVVWSGDITESSWSWVPDAPVFLGINGFLTQTIPSKPGHLYRRSVGVARTSQTIRFAPSLSVVLA